MPTVNVRFLEATGLIADVMVVVKLTLDVCGVDSFAEDSEGNENRDVSPPRMGSGV